MVKSLVSYTQSLYRTILEKISFIKFLNISEEIVNINNRIVRNNVIIATIIYVYNNLNFSSYRFNRFIFIIIYLINFYIDKSRINNNNHY